MHAKLCLEITFRIFNSDCLRRQDVLEWVDGKMNSRKFETPCWNGRVLERLSLTHMETADFFMQRLLRLKNNP